MNDRRVWKYALEPYVRLMMSPSAKVLTVGVDPDLQPSLWAEVWPDLEQSEPRDFVVIGTGHPVPDDGEYVGTILNAGRYVWHVYEVAVQRG